MSGDDNNLLRRQADAVLYEMKGKVDAIHQTMICLKEWTERHAGQGEGTEHGIIDKRLSNHSTKINWIIGVGSGIGAISGLYATIKAWFGGH